MRRKLIAAFKLLLLVALLSVAVLYGLAVRQGARAQACLREIIAMRLGTATFADAQRVANEYGGKPWDAPLRPPHCSDDDCFLRFFFHNTPFNRFPGVREVMLSITVTVKGGHVVGRDIEYAVATPQAAPVAYELVDGLHDLNNPGHPGARDYDVQENWVDYGVPRLLEVHLTPRSTVQQRDHAYSLDLSCLARAFGCSTQSAIFPRELWASVRNP